MALFRTITRTTSFNGPAMNRGKKILIVISCAIFFTHAQTGDSLTVSQAIGRAIKTNASLAALQKGLAAAQARTGQAESAYYPLVN